MKCDETKPDCVRCTSTGRRCDGYQSSDLKRDRSKSETPVFESELSIINSKKVPIPRSTGSLITVNGNDVEKRSFQYFRTHTVPQLGGFFDEEIWERMVLQAAHTEPVIRHAVFALGSLHERFDMGDLTVFASNGDAAQGGLALKQYTRAINHLITQSKPAETPSLDVCLIASALFAGFEVSGFSTKRSQCLTDILTWIRSLEAITGPQSLI